MTPLWLIQWYAFLVFLLGVATYLYVLTLAGRRTRRALLTVGGSLLIDLLRRRRYQRGRHRRTPVSRLVWASSG